MGEVVHTYFGSSVDKRVMLRKLAEDEELEGVMVVCVWKNGNLTTGWSDMSTGQLAIGSLMMQQEALKASFIDDKE